MPVNAMYCVMHGVALRAGTGGVLTRQANDPIRAHGPGVTARTGRAKASRAGPRDRAAREGAGGHPDISAARPSLGRVPPGHVPLVTSRLGHVPLVTSRLATSRCCNAPRHGHARRGLVPSRSRPISVASHLGHVPMGHIPSRPAGPARGATMRLIPPLPLRRAGGPGLRVEGIRPGRLPSRRDVTKRDVTELGRDQAGRDRVGT